MLDDLIWGTAATANTVSWIHMDDEGFATSAIVITGSKYWVIYRRKRDLPDNEVCGDLGSIKLLKQEEWSNHDLNHQFEAEGVLLHPGCIL